MVDATSSEAFRVRNEKAVVICDSFIELERRQSRRTDHFSNIVADREFSTDCYLFP